MKIASGELRPIRLRLRRPLWTAHGPLTERRGLLLRLRGQDGTRGLGEATPLPGFGTETLTEAERALRRCIPLLVDTAGAGDPAERLAELDAAGACLGPSARAAVDCALCDLAARAEGLPLAEWLAARSGGRARGRVEVSKLMVEQQPDALAAEAKAAVQMGFRALKLKGGDPDPQRDLERMSAARAGAGPRTRIRLDANEAWTEAQARDRLQALVPFAPEYVEQPVPRAEIGALARLRRDAAVPIAADEAMNHAAGAQRVLELRAADVVVLKPAAAGGISRTRELAIRAQRAGVRVVLTSLLDGAVSVTAAVQLAASLPEAPLACGLATSALLSADVAAAPKVEDGWISVPSGAGLGIELQR